MPCLSSNQIYRQTAKDPLRFILLHKNDVQSLYDAKNNKKKYKRIQKNTVHGRIISEDKMKRKINYCVEFGYFLQMKIMFTLNWILPRT